MDDSDRQTIPPAEQGDRDDKGRLLPGHSVGESTRFVPGQSGNPNGRPSFGASIKEWANILAESSKRELLEITEDDDAPSAKVAAAQQVMQARDGDGKAFDRLCDRTEGRPSQSIAIEPRVDVKSIEQVAVEAYRFAGLDRVAVAVVDD